MCRCHHITSATVCVYIYIVGPSPRRVQGRHPGPGYPALSGPVGGEAAPKSALAQSGGVCGGVRRHDDQAGR